MIKNVTGIILAGGKSTRLGTDKAFLKIGEKTVIEDTLAKFKNTFKEVIIIANETKKFDFLGVEVIPDIISSKGPLGGIYTGLIKSSSFYNFIAACDMPFINMNLLHYMLEKTCTSEVQVVVPRYNGRLQPLYAIYSKNCIKHIESQLRKNNLKITDFFPSIKVSIITEKEIENFDPWGRCFMNINTPQEYRSLASINRSLSHERI